MKDKMKYFVMVISQRAGKNRDGLCYRCVGSADRRPDRP